MNLTPSSCCLKNIGPLRHLSLVILLLCGFSTWIAHDFHNANARINSVSLAESQEFIAANNSDILRGRTGLRKVDLSDKVDSDNNRDSEKELVWLLFPADPSEFTVLSAANKNLLTVSFSRSTFRYLLKAPRAPPFA